MAPAQWTPAEWTAIAAVIVSPAVALVVAAIQIRAMRAGTKEQLEASAAIARQRIEADAAVARQRIWADTALAMRRKWIDDYRAAVSEFQSAVAAYLAAVLARRSTHVITGEDSLDGQLERIVLLRAKLRLFLDPRAKDDDAVTSAIEYLYDAAIDCTDGAPVPEMNPAYERLLVHSRAVIDRYMRLVEGNDDQNLSVQS